MASDVKIQDVQCYGMDETNIGGECQEWLTLTTESTESENGWTHAEKYGAIRYYCRFHSSER